MKPKAVIFDIEGTLSDSTHREHLIKKADWTEFYSQLINDPPKFPVVELAKSLVDRAGYAMILLTGRVESVSSITKKWLEGIQLPYDLLIHRRDGNFQRDDIFKRDMYERVIAPDYDVRFAVDDRARIIRMWREIGLTAFQVADDVEAPSLNLETTSQLEGNISLLRGELADKNKLIADLQGQIDRYSKQKPIAYRAIPKRRVAQPKGGKKK